MRSWLLFQIQGIYLLHPAAQTDVHVSCPEFYRSECWTNSGPALEEHNLEVVSTNCWYFVTAEIQGQLWYPLSKPRFYTLCLVAHHKLMYCYLLKYTCYCFLVASVSFPKTRIMSCTLYGAQTGLLEDGKTIHSVERRGCTQSCASRRGQRACPGSSGSEIPGPHLPGRIMMVSGDCEMW